MFFFFKVISYKKNIFIFSVKAFFLAGYLFYLKFNNHIALNMHSINKKKCETYNQYNCSIKYLTLILYKYLELSKKNKQLILLENNFFIVNDNVYAEPVSLFLRILEVVVSSIDCLGKILSKK